MSHTCHAIACNAEVPPRMFMCRPHWYKLRKPLRDAIWNEYRAGQERDKSPSKRYLCVQRRAVAEVAFKPHDEDAARVSAPYFLTSHKLRLECIAEGLGDPLGGICPMPEASA